MWSWQAMTARRSIRLSSTDSWPHDGYQSKALLRVAAKIQVWRSTPHSQPFSILELLPGISTLCLFDGDADNP
jgi:hypothetical protein